MFVSFYAWGITSSDSRRTSYPTEVVRPDNGSRISGEPSLKRFGDCTRAGASRHEPPYPEPEGRRIEGGGARDGLVQGSSVCSGLLCSGSQIGRAHV